MKLFFRTALFLFLALGISKAQTCSTLISDGRTFLTTSNLVAANARFAAAVALCPDDPTANALYAATRLAVLPNTPAISNFLTRVGVPLAGRSIYNWTAEPPRDTNGVLLAPAGVNANEFAAVLRTNLLPTIQAAEANLAKITQTNFLLSLTKNETKIADVTLDYGDVQLLRAMLRAWEYWSYTVYSWNLNVQLSSLRALYDSDILSIQRVLQDNPALLTFNTTNDLLAARQAFTNGVARYLEASSIIRNRPGNVNRLFMYDFTRANEEERFRNSLADLRASLQNPVVLTIDTNYTIHLARHFEGLTSPRSVLPSFSGDIMLTGTLPDPTFGGLVPSGLTQSAAEDALSEFVKSGTFMTNARMVGDQISFDFKTIPGQAYGLEFSYDLLDWFPLYEISASSNSVHFVDTLDNSATRFYRLTRVAKFITIKGKVLDACSRQPLAGAIVRTSLDFATAVAGADGRFTLHTETHEGVPLGYDISADAPGHQTATVSVFESFSLSQDLFPAPLNIVAPANDDYNNRTALTGVPAISVGSSCGASVQFDDPDAPSGGTTWWSWTSTAPGNIQVTAAGLSPGQYRVRVYFGTVWGQLVLLTNNFDTLTFPANSGQTYQICVEDVFNTGSAITLSIIAPPALTIASPLDGANFAAPANLVIQANATAQNGSIRDVRFYLNGNLVGIDSNSPYEYQFLNASPGEYYFTVVATDSTGVSASESRYIAVRPPNDNFANRTPLLGSSMTVTGNNHFASLEPGEPVHGDSPCCSIWWTWTAQYSGFVTIKATGRPPYGDNAAYLGIYRGTSLTTLFPVANSSVQGSDLSTQVSFDVTSGTAYQIAVAGFSEGAELTLQIQPSAAPSVTLTEPPTEVLYWGPTSLAVSAEAEDPDGSISKVEFYANGHLIGTDFTAPYSVTWSNVVAGFYDLQAKAFDDTGVATWSSKILIPVAAINDNFDSRIVLSGTNTLGYGSNEGTSREYMEPPIQEQTSFQTVWYEWVAPQSGMVTMRVNGPANSYPLLGVFTGPFVYALTEVSSATSNGSGDYGTAEVTFLATQGTSYKITVASEFSTSFAFTLRITMP